MTSLSESGALVAAREKGPLVYRQPWITRVTHWVWVVCLFFLLFSGLQIFNAHPALYIGQESGFEYDNAVLRMQPAWDGQAWRGQTVIFGRAFDTHGVFGMSGTPEQPRGFPAWATIPSYQDLATGRVVHFFFAWVLVTTLFVWLLHAVVTRRLWREVLPRLRDWRALPGDIADHLRFRFRHGRSYNPLQRLAYGFVFVILFPLLVLTGLTMSPGMDAAWPWLVDLFGGRQTARTLHFGAMALLTVFFVVHVVMVVLAGPFNELRSMITGWYRTSPGTPRQEGDR